MFDLYIFDLDGTLINSKPGVTGSVQYALRQQGIHVDDLDLLTKFIGPPLHDSFRDFYGFGPQEVAKAVEDYRDIYARRGMFDAEIYEGIIPLLKSLKQAGKPVCIATTKAKPVAEDVLNHFELTQYFDKIIGSNTDGTLSDKAELIPIILEDYPHIPKHRVAMIGDRKFDIDGAKACGIKSIAVNWGFGSPEEFARHGADMVIDEPREIG